MGRGCCDDATSYPWPLVKEYLAFKLESILSRFYKEKGFKPQSKDDKYEPRHEDFFAQLLDFPAFVEARQKHTPEISTITQRLCATNNRAPFTIQRLCEVILKPEHYTQTNALLFGLEKMVSVSTVQKSLKPDEVEKVNSSIKENFEKVHSAPVRPTVETTDKVYDFPSAKS